MPPAAAPGQEPVALAAPPRPDTAPERPGDHRQALAWFEAEHQVLLAAIASPPTRASTAMPGRSPARCRYTSTSGAIRMSGSRSWALPLTAATRLDDELGQAVSLRGLGSACSSTGDYDQARAHLERCLSLYQRLGDRMGEAWTQQNLAKVAEDQGRYADGLTHSERTLCLYQATGHEAGQAEALNCVGWFHALLGDYQQARAFCEQSLALTARLDSATSSTTPGTPSVMSSFASATWPGPRLISNSRSACAGTTATVAMKHRSSPTPATRTTPLANCHRPGRHGSRHSPSMTTAHNPGAGTVRAKLASLDD